mgnify:FL=1
MNAKRQKLKDQFEQEHPAEIIAGSKIFAGVNIHVDGYTSKLLCSFFHQLVKHILCELFVQ